MKNYLNVMAIIGGSMVCASSFAGSSIAFYCNNADATDDYYCYNKTVCTTELECNEMTGTTSKCSSDANGETTCTNTGFFTDSEGNETGSSMDLVKIHQGHDQSWTFICAKGSPISPTHNKYWYKGDEYWFTSEKKGDDRVKWTVSGYDDKEQRPNWMACSQ